MQPEPRPACLGREHFKQPFMKKELGNQLGKSLGIGLTLAVSALFAGSVMTFGLRAADGKHSVKDFMKSYHKAPKGVEPVCKKASEGKASADELAKLVAGYKDMCSAKPPKGDETSWKEKTTKLLEAAQALQKGAPDGAARYKEAVNCKGCHSAHKPD
jgi:hypothetical protein